MIDNGTLRIKPSLHNITFDSTPGQLPATPVLSILQLKFRSEVDLDDPSQPVSGLWRSSVEFISTIPGFQGVYWAPESKSSIIVLIQWDSGLAWKRFQCSLGFSMLLGYLDQVYNHCVQIALPNHLASSRFRLELVSYEFPARSDTSPHVSPDERQDHFKNRWESIFKSHVGDDLIHASGGWIEEDFHAENQYFVGLVSRKSDPQSDNIQQQSAASDQKVADQLAALAKQANAVVSSMTGHMRYENVFPSQNTAPVAVSTQPNLKHPLLDVPTTRQCDVVDLDSLRHEDRVHLETLEASTTPGNKRTAPGPAGGWFSMGSINQHHHPAPPRPRLGKMVEMVSFYVRETSSHFTSVFADFRASLWKLRDCPPVRWGTDAEDTARTFVLADLGDLKSAPAQAQEQFHQLIRNFEAACGGAIQHLTYMQIPLLENLDHVPNLEITTFYIPDDGMDRRSFEYAYDNLVRTTYVQKQYGPPINSARAPPATVCASGWASKDGQSDDCSKTAKFTTIWSWHKGQPTREAWYAEFIERARNEYDRLGHVVDWLRILSRSVDCLFLVFVNWDRVIGPLNLEYLSKGQPPLQLFGVPS